MNRFPGKTLKGKKYKPLFPYFAKVCRLCSCSFLLVPYTKLQYKHFNRIKTVVHCSTVFRMYGSVCWDLLGQKSFPEVNPTPTKPKNNTHMLFY